jgi:hypothetical protein
MATVRDAHGWAVIALLRLNCVESDYTGLAAVTQKWAFHQAASTILMVRRTEETESGSPSRTAILTATHRAAHLVLDHPPIFRDPFARAFAGFASDEDLLDSLDRFVLPDFPSHRALFALRSRYAEDELAAAVRSEGISQYVILGAGLDSFAYRCPDEMRSLRIFEVDHPSSQVWKRARLAELGIQPPPTLRYIPVDFEREALSQRLDAGGVDGGAKAFFFLARRYPIPDKGGRAGHPGRDCVRKRTRKSDSCYIRRPSDRARGRGSKNSDLYGGPSCKHRGAMAELL